MNICNKKITRAEGNGGERSSREALYSSFSYTVLPVDSMGHEYLEDLVEVDDVRVAQLEEDFRLACMKIRFQQVLRKFSSVRDLYGHL